MRRLTLCIAVLLLPISSVALTMSKDRAVAPPSAVLMGGGLPVVASDGTSVLAVWGDADGLSDTAIGAAGVIDPMPARRIRSASADGVVMVWSGNAYVVAWTEGTTVLTATLDRSGELRSEPQIIATDSSTLQLAWNGAHALLLTWSGATQRPLGQLLDAGGNVVRRDIVFPDIDRDPALVAANGFFFVFRTTTRIVTLSPGPPPTTQVETTIFTTRVDDRGNVMEHASIPIIDTDQIGPIRLAYDGRFIAIAFMTYRYQTPHRLQRYLLDPATMQVKQLADFNATGVIGAVAVSGGVFVATWVDSNSQGFRIGTLSFTTDAITGFNYVIDGLGSASEETAAATAERLYVFWNDHSRGGSDSMALALTPDGKSKTGDRFLIHGMTQPEVAPAIAPGLVVWSEAKPLPGTGELFASRLNADGIAIEPPIRLSTSGSVQTDSAPHVVFTGAIWFVAWTEGTVHTTRRMMRRVALDGTLPDPAPVPIAYVSSLAFNGTTIAAPATASNGDLVLQRWDRYGRALDPVTLAPKAYAYPAQIASNGRDFLIVHTIGSDWWQGPSPDLLDVVARRVTADGTLLDPVPIGVATGPLDQLAPAVASDGHDYLVSWFEVPFASTPDAWKLKVQRVSSGGFLNGPPVTVDDPSPLPFASLAGDAHGYWLTWRGGDVYHPMLHVARLDVSGNVIESAVASPAVTGDPGVSSSGDLAYARWDDALSSTRVFTRHLSSGSPPHGRAAGR